MNLHMRLKSLPSELSLPPPAGLSSSNPGLWKLIYAAVFPVGLLMVVLSGAELYTGARPFTSSHPPLWTCVPPAAHRCFLHVPSACVPPTDPLPLPPFPPAPGFPLALSLCTGNTALVPLALLEGHILPSALARSWVLSYVGNLVGSLLMVALVWASGALAGNRMPAEVAFVKTSSPWGEAVLKGLLANW